MKISALDLKRQITPIRPQIDLSIKKVIDNAGFILGEAVERFEKQAARYCGAKYALGVSNGTDAISLALLALGIKAGDGVICPAFTYYATAGAVAGIGARPVFADIDADTYNISPEGIKHALARKSKLKIKAVIPVHLYGQCAHMHEVLRLSRRYGLKVIEDAAQAFGAEYRGKKAGTLGDCGAVSFYPAKNLGAFGDAGMVLTENKKIAQKIRILRNQGNARSYYHLILGRNNRMDALQAAVLEVKLKYLDGWNRQRQELAAYFNKNLSGLKVKTPYAAPYSTHIYHQYVLRAPVSNKPLISYLLSKGIDSRLFYPLPLHLQRCFKYLGYKKGSFPEAERAARQTFTLPIDPNLTREEKDYIVRQTRSACAS